MSILFALELKQANVYDKIETSIGKINKKKGKIGCCSSLYIMMKNRTNMLNMQFHVSSSAVEHCCCRWWWWLCSMFSEMENIFYYKFVCVWNPGPSKKKYTLLAIALSLSLLVTTHNVSHVYYEHWTHHST